LRWWFPISSKALEGDGKALSAVTVKDMDGTIRSLPAQHLLAFFGLSMELGPMANWGLNLSGSHIAVAHGTMRNQRRRAFSPLATSPPMHINSSSSSAALPKPPTPPTRFVHIAYTQM
jgi:hypothetical protein